MKSHIKKHLPIGREGLVVHAQIVGAEGQNPEPASLLASLCEATNRKFTALANSVISLKREGNSHFLRAIMVPTIDAVPVGDDMKGFTALSANMYVDNQDALWGLRESDAGRIMVRATEPENIEQLMDMMSSISCSAVALRSQSPTLANLFEGHEKMLTGLEVGDVVSYYSESSSAIQVGSVVATGTMGTESAILVAPFSGAQQEEVSTSAVAVFVDGASVEYPEVQASYSSGGAPDIERMVDYYRRMFSYNESYFKDLESRIRNHAFC